MAHWADQYLYAPYRTGGRGPRSYDCWGFVQAALAEQYDKHLPIFGHVTRKGGENIQNAHDQLRSTVKMCEPQDGAIAAVYRGGIFEHVGLVLEIDAKNWVQHTSSHQGAERLTLKQWMKKFPQTRFYRVVD